MRLVVVGAAGQTGRLVVEQAVAAGHDVTALVRTPRTYDAPGVTVRVGDATDAAAVAAAVKDHDAVIDTVGGRTPYRHTTLEADVARTVIAAMRHHGVRRLVVTSSLGVGDSIANTPALVRVVVATFLRGSTRDKTHLEQLVRESDLDWTITRPAVLSNKPATGDVRIVTVEGGEKASPLPRADLAAFLIGELVEPHLRATLTLSGG